MKKLRPGEMVQIKTVEELLGVVNEESAMDIRFIRSVVSRDIRSK